MSDLKIVATDQAPAAIGPYSQAIAANGFVFASGQIPLTAAGQLVEGGIEAQTRQVLANLKAVLEAAGSGLDRVVKTTVFVQDLGDFATVNSLYEAAFGAHKPARSTVQVARLPRDVLVEIEAVALQG
ncbi:RidA family protein [Caenispirillum bisanense]|uniref:RidA family protein n=1 Tax=Caenispirillum bisanense TaxID=414052 RepID=UPI003CD066C5